MDEVKAKTQASIDEVAKVLDKAATGFPDVDVKRVFRWLAEKGYVVKVVKE